MSGLREQIRQRWQEAASTTQGGYEWRARRLDCPAPVVVLAGVREADECFALLIEAPLNQVAAPRFRFRASGVSVDDQPRPEEELRRLAIVLEMAELMDVFETLAADMAEVVSAAPTVPLAFNAATARLEAWQACLNARRARISAEQQIGLMGELELFARLAAQIGHSMTVEAWRGPLEGLHDFSRASVAIEVKSILGPGRLIRVNDVHQLDRSGLVALAIARPRFIQSENAPNVTETLGRVRQDIEQCAPAAVAEFDRKVLFTGIVPGSEDLNVRGYLDGIDMYLVGDGFPWIDPALLPNAVSGIRYDLDERHLQDFRMDEHNVRTLMLGLGGLHSDD